MTNALQLGITTLAIGLAISAPAWAETPAQVHQRLEQYRQLDEAAAQRKALQAVEAAQRHERTLQWQEQRRREEYARRWRCYGEVEIDVLSWRQRKHETWVTSSQLASDKCSTTTHAGRIWVRLRYGASVEKLADDLAYDESRLARLNGVDLDHYFQSGDWLLLPAWTNGQVDKAFAIDSSSIRKVPPPHEPANSQPPLPPTSPPSSRRELVGVSCASLMINRKAPDQGWGNWIRPVQGSPDEQLVIDRCATASQ